MTTRNLTEDSVEIVIAIRDDMGTSTQRESVRSLQRELERRLKDDHSGIIDGDEFGGGRARIFIFGPSADRLYDSFERVFEARSDVRVVEVIKIFHDTQRRVSISQTGLVEHVAKRAGPKIRWRAGDVFLINLLDGSRVVGQVVAEEDVGVPSATCALYDIRIDATSSVVPDNLAEERVISCQFLTPDLLENGVWQIVAHARPTISRRLLPYEHLRQEQWVGATVIGSRRACQLLEAYYGLRAWNAWKDKKYFDKLLVDPAKRPSNVILVEEEG